MSKARDIASAAPAPSTVSATELGYLDGVTSAVQTQIDSKIGQSTAINPTIVDAKGDLITATAADTPARLAVGTNDQILVADSSTATGLKWATPATGSTNITLKRSRQNSNDTYRSIATDGSTKWVIVGDAGVLYSSTDSGATWTSRTSGFGSTQIRDVVYGNGIFVAVGASGKLSTSTDTVTWTSRTSGFGSNAISRVNYVNGYFFALGTAGSTSGVSTSTDGITWTLRTTPAGSPNPVFAVTYGNGYYVIVGEQSSYNTIYSTDLATWTNLTSGPSGNIYAAFYENNQFILMNQQLGGESWYTGNNPTTGWQYFYPDNATSGTIFPELARSYGGNLYVYPTTTPQNFISKNKLEVTGGNAGGWTEIYKPYTSELPTSIVAIVSKGDGTFGLLNTKGYVWFTS
jgi:photosystem II stability/assembly factor-like uncharacterized protein